MGIRNSEPQSSEYVECMRRKNELEAKISDWYEYLNRKDSVLTPEVKVAWLTKDIGKVLGYV